MDESTCYVRMSSRVVKHRNKGILENNLYYVKKNYLTFFSFKMLMGNKKTALEEPNSVVITESIAEKYFGREDPLGKILQFEDFSFSLEVTGVTEDPPKNSSFYYDFLVSLKTGDRWRAASNPWEPDSTVFLRLPDEFDLAIIDSKFHTIIKEDIPAFKGKNIKMNLFPLVDIHLKSLNIMSSFYRTTPVQFYLVLGMAIVLLIVVCVNFMNLSTARYTNRAKEVGLRKVMGATRSGLIKQFLSESIFLSFLSLFVAIILFEVIRPIFLRFIGANIDLTLWNKWYVLLIITAVTFLVGVIAGSYPAFFLSSFNPVTVFRTRLGRTPKSSMFRKVLVISQFTLAVTLMILMLVVNKQFDHLLNTDLGFNRTNLIALPVKKTNYEQFQRLKEKLIEYPEIKSAALTNWLPYNWDPMEKIVAEGQQENEGVNMCCYPVGYGFVETLDMEIIKGRSFSEEFNDANNFVIDELAANRLLWKDPIGKWIRMGDQEGKIIGVVKAFHFRHLFFGFSPSILHLKPHQAAYMLVKTDRPPDEQIQALLEKEWKQFLPDMLFETSIVDHGFEDEFRKSTKASESFKFIALISLLISCLGLFGLSSFMLEKRSKEIGIRKSLGASSGEVLWMFLKEFSYNVLIANIIAFPIAYILSRSFLEWAWVTRISIDPAFFLIAAILSIIAALVSVIIQTVRSSLENPIKALRCE